MFSSVIVFGCLITLIVCSVLTACQAPDEGKRVRLTILILSCLLCLAMFIFLILRNSLSLDINSLFIAILNACSYICGALGIICLFFAMCECPDYSSPYISGLFIILCCIAIPFLIGGYQLQNYVKDCENEKTFITYQEKGFFQNLPTIINKEQKEELVKAVDKLREGVKDEVLSFYLNKENIVAEIQSSFYKSEEE